jgi:hypothetical protein
MEVREHPIEIAIYYGIFPEYRNYTPIDAFANNVNRKAMKPTPMGSLEWVSWLPQPGIIG